MPEPIVLVRRAGVYEVQRSTLSETHYDRLMKEISSLKVKIGGNNYVNNAYLVDAPKETQELYQRIWLIEPPTESQDWQGVDGMYYTYKEEDIQERVVKLWTEGDLVIYPNRAPQKYNP